MEYRLHEQTSNEYEINCDQINLFISTYFFSVLSHLLQTFFFFPILKQFDLTIIWLIAITFCYYNFSIFTYKLLSWSLSFSIFCYSKMMNYWSDFGAWIYFYFSSIAEDYNLRNNYREWEAHWFFLLISVLLSASRPKVFNIGVRTLIYYKIKSKPFISQSANIFIPQDFGFLFTYCCSIIPWKRLFAYRH